MRVPCAHVSALAVLGTCLLGASCVVTSPAQPKVVTAQAPAAAMPPPAMTPADERREVAVLPLDDEQLFRAERAALRAELAGHLARLAPDHAILPIAEVDAKLLPVSRSTGHRCAFEGEPVERRAWEQEWMTTEVLHITGEKGEALWVGLLDGKQKVVATFEAPWSPKLGPVDRYRAAFAAFVPTDGGGFPGGLGGAASLDAALREGPVTVCEYHSLSCDRGSVDWKDRAGGLAACFSGEDDVTRDVLVQGDAGTPRCEIENLDSTDSREGAREACLCRALTASAAMGTRPGRRTIRVHYEAPDLAGKPRPDLRVVEVSTNLPAEDDWHSMWLTVDGKTQYSSLRGLTIDNLEALAAPLARCAVPAGNVMVADIEVREDGTAAGGRIVSSAPDRESAACVEKALGRGAFTCTNDGKPARVRVGVEGRAAQGPLVPSKR
ncbi:hypothetical protein [Polyangium aurulentum]|uniref:hypothetical protein n=1 Tax=Polyangium aurulentum TaxID=2567896 RepID=UPI0010AEDEF8|nr:hypothetical protein [Polyangium aurulentum]UQA59796.1 hypothetical protein E8A73_004655 [Polyangium aurulentum]